MAMSMARSAMASVVIDASPEEIWEIVADVTRGGEWSVESLGCDWLGDAREARPGARFKGRNKRGRFNWSRVSEVVSADRPRELVWRTLPSALYPDSTEWRLTLEPEAGGTRVTEGFRIVRMPRLMEMAIYWSIPMHRDRSGDLAADLGQLKALVEARDRNRQTV